LLGRSAHGLPGPLSDLNRTRLRPLIERVFDEFDSPDEVIRIDRLALDLGRFGEDALRHVEPRLELAKSGRLQG
jgi:hypothetical protein